MSTDRNYTLGTTKTADQAWEEVEESLWLPTGISELTSMFGLSTPFRVTAREALELAAVMICLDVLSQDISKATLRLKRRVKNGSKVVEPKDHPIAEMLALEPNRRHTWTEFTSMTIFHLGLVSNAYVYIRRNRDGDPLALVPVMPSMVAERINQTTGEVFYDINAATVQEQALLGGYAITAPERDVIHIRQRMIDGFYGYSTLTAGGRTISMGRRLDEYQRTMFSKNGVQRGVFTRPKESSPMTDDGFARLREQLRIMMRNVNGGGDPIVLEEGVDFKSVSMTAAEADFTKMLDNEVGMICKLWRMPPHKAMHLAAVKYENLATLEMIYVRDTLIPICRLVEERLGRQMLTRAERLEMYLEYDRDEMSIVDQANEVTRVTKLVERGVISHNEARIDQGYNPRLGGDVYSIPASSILVDGKGNTIVSASKDAAENAPEPDPETDTPPADDAAPKKSMPSLVVNNR